MLSRVCTYHNSMICKLEQLETSPKSSNKRVAKSTTYCHTQKAVRHLRRCPPPSESKMHGHSRCVMSVKIVSCNITKNHRATFQKHSNNTIRFSMIIDILIKAEKKKKIQKFWKVTYQIHKVPSFCLHGSLKRIRWLSERRGTRGLGVAEARGADRKRLALHSTSFARCESLPFACTTYAKCT